VTSKSVGSQGSVELEETGKFESDWKEWTNQIEALKLDIVRMDTGDWLVRKKPLKSA